MGTLSGFSFSTVDFCFKSRAIRSLELNKGSNNSCLMCFQKSLIRRERGNLFRNFDRFRCYSSSENDNKHTETTNSTPKDSSATTIPTDSETRSRNDFDSEDTRPTSVSSRVRCLEIYLAT